MHPNIIKLNASHIPQYTQHTTLKLEGLDILEDIVRKKKYVDDNTGVLRSYYLEAGAKVPEQRKAVTATAVFAKELRLSGNEVCYSPIATFMREMVRDSLPRESISMNPVMKHVGKGYIVVPEFHTLDWLATIYPLREVHDFEGMLLNHLDRGGAFVFCGKARGRNDVTEFGQAFAASFEKHFTTIMVR